MIISVQLLLGFIALHPTLKERQQLGFVKLNGKLAFSGWVGLAYDC